MALTSLAAALLGGCLKPVHFPAEPLAEAAKLAGAYRAYDADHDGKADYFLFTNTSGRICRIAYDHTGDGKPDAMVDLDAIPTAQCRHLVIILDGFGYDVVKDYYDKGSLRMFHPPSRVIAPYPTLTDVSMEDILGYIPCQGFEAMYYNRKAGNALKSVGKKGVVLPGDNDAADVARAFKELGRPDDVAGYELNFETPDIAGWNPAVQESIANCRCIRTSVDRLPSHSVRTA